MWKNEYKPPRLRSGDLRTPVTFYEYTDNNGPEPGEKEKQVLYKCFAKIDEMWLKDMEQAKQNNTESDITIIIRDAIGTYSPTTSIIFLLTIFFTRTIVITLSMYNLIYKIEILSILLQG